MNKPMSQQIKEVMAELGKRGKGKSKVRGDSDYYSKLSKAYWDKKRKNK